MFEKWERVRIGNMQDLREGMLIRGDIKEANRAGRIVSIARYQKYYNGSDIKSITIAFPHRPTHVVVRSAILRLPFEARACNPVSTHSSGQSMDWVHIGTELHNHLEHFAYQKYVMGTWDTENKTQAEDMTEIVIEILKKANGFSLRFNKDSSTDTCYVAKDVKEVQDLIGKAVTKHLTDKPETIVEKVQAIAKKFLD